MTTITAPGVRRSAPPTLRKRLGAWLLILSPLPFALAIAATVQVSTVHGPISFDDLTPAQMDEIAGWWILSSLAMGIAYGAGLVGTILVAREASAGRGRPWAAGATVVGAIGLALGLGFAAMRAAAVGFDATRLGDDSVYQVGHVVGYVGYGFGMLALVLVSVAMYRGGVHRVGGLVIGIISLIALLAYVVAPPYTPPFTIALIWLPLGIVWLRGTERTARPVNP